MLPLFSIIIVLIVFCCSDCYNCCFRCRYDCCYSMSSALKFVVYFNLHHLKHQLWKISWSSFRINNVTIIKNRLVHIILPFMSHQILVPLRISPPNDTSESTIASLYKHIETSHYPCFLILKLLSYFVQLINSYLLDTCSTPWNSRQCTCIIVL